MQSEWLGWVSTQKLRPDLTKDVCLTGSFKEGEKQKVFLVVVLCGAVLNDSVTWLSGLLPCADISWFFFFDTVATVCVTKAISASWSTRTPRLEESQCAA